MLLLEKYLQIVRPVLAAVSINGLKGEMLGRKEGMGFLRLFQQLRSCRNEVETRNREEIPFFSQMVSRGLLIAKEP